tara:strand:- start:1456 stop:1827 length:372 start_codon:yes stop_codon:yes gene_type:complete
MILKEKKMNDYGDHITITSGVDTINIDNNTYGDLTITSLAGNTMVSDSTGNTHVTGELTVNERDVMAEIDELREALMLPSRNINLEENYPELKEAYDTYMEVYRGIRVADRLEKTGEQYGDES